MTPRDGRPARHRIPAQRQDSPGTAAAPDDRELDSYLAALGPGGIPGATELTGRFGSAQVFALRLPALRIEQLRRLAVTRGTSPGALAVDWVLERLDQEDTETGPLSIPVDPVPVDIESRTWRDTLRRLGRQ